MKVLVGLLLCVAAASAFKFPANFFQPHAEGSVFITHDYTSERVTKLIAQGTINSERQKIFPPYPTSKYVDVYCQNRDQPVPVLVKYKDIDFENKVDVTREVVLKGHGWMDTVDGFFYGNGTRELLLHEDVTACYIDYDYLTVVMLNPINTTAIGEYMAEYLTWFSQYVPLNKISYVGHSAGAEIAGICGYKLGGQLKAIYGLDAVDSEDESIHFLDRSDARFVQIILTSSGFIGTKNPSAHQVFWPNGGNGFQPDCGIIPPVFMFCDHLRAIDYWIASLNPENKFWARRCADKSTWQKEGCGAGLDFLGFRTNKLEGQYFLRTIGVEPFTLDIDGANPK